MPMSWSIRRGVLVLVAVLTLGATAWLQHGHAQQLRLKRPIQPVPVPQPAQPLAETVAPDGGNRDAFENAGIKLPEDERHLASKIEAANDYIKDKDWKEAVRLLQMLVDIKSDVFAKVPRKTPDNKEILAWVSVKDEANRLIGSLPKEGMDFYKVTFGQDAADLLKKARETGDRTLLGEVIRRFRHTDAGREALGLLASRQLHRGEYVTASGYFKQLLAREGADKLPDAVWVAAAIAAHQDGSKEGQETEKEIWKRLRGLGRDLTLGTETRSVSEVEAYVANLPRNNFGQDASDSPLYRSNPSRTNQMVGGAAFLDPTWRVKAVVAGSPGDTSPAVAEGWLRKAMDRPQFRGQPILPSFSPVTATVVKGEQRMSLLLFRSYWGIHAVELKSGKVFWESPSTWSLQRMLNTRAGDARKSQALASWLQFYVDQNQKPQILWENSVVGTLSSDNNFVYVVDDLAVPPPPHFVGHVNPGFPGGMQGGNLDPVINDAVQHSRLQAYSLTKGGKLEWEIGGKDDKSELADCCFLAPPLPMGGKIYLLVEKQQEIRLVCVDPLVPAPGRPDYHVARVLSSQTLGSTKDRIQADVNRRTSAAHLAYGEGILVCPTNAGAVFGVNLLENSLVWAYPYRDKTDTAQAGVQPGMGMGMGGRVIMRPGGPIMIGPDGQPINPASSQSGWKVTAPVIQDGKVVFTAPDARSVHCVNLRDGSRVWARPRQEDDLFLAGVYNGKVLLVGKKSVRALALSSGEQVWSLETGLPSGQGIASDNVYYLPLKEAGRSKEPEICAIDVDRGQFVAHTRSRKVRDGDNIRYEVPGNLLFYEGSVVSQTPTEVVAYPQLTVRIAEMDKRLLDNPNDPEGLMQRGVLRQDKGDLAGAISDLSRSLKNNPPPEVRSRARAKLYDTLTDYIQRDFNRAEEYLGEYEELCKVESEADASESAKAEAQAEQRRRRANFLCLVAKGREAQGRLVEAFDRYEQFGEVAGSQELVSVIDEPAVKAAPDVWSRGRIAAMVARASEEQRRPLEDRIAQRWKKVHDTSDLEELRQFVRMFGAFSAAGKEARFQLAERLMEQNQFLEAEKELCTLRGPQEAPETAGRAVEALARLYARKGLLEDAAYCYRRLNREYAKTIIRDGKTGSDIYNDDAGSDRRILPHLDEPNPLNAPALKGHGEQKPFPQVQTPTFQFQHSGEPLPFFRHYAVGVRPDLHQAKLIVRATGDEVGEPMPIPRTMFQAMIHSSGQPHALRFSYQTLGHLVVLPVGHVIVAIDPVSQKNPKVLWQKNLVTPSEATTGTGGNAPAFQQVVIDPHDGSLQVLYQDNWRQRLGGVAPLEGGVLCVQTSEALTALDPVTGRTLWVRTDVNRHNHLFADAGHVYVVELGDDNSPAQTRVFRASDGVTVKAPDFAPLFGKKLRTVGGALLLSEPGDGGTVALRLYDILTGQDLWKQTFAARSLVLQSEDPNLAGAVEPDGKVHVIDLRTRKEVLNSKLYDGAAHLNNAQTAHLVADSGQFYVVLNRAQDPNLARFGGLQSNLMVGTGMRCIPVNGYVEAFRRANGEVNWNAPVVNQMMVLDQFEDLPIVLFTARHSRWQNMQGRGMMVQQVVNLQSIEKRTGKALDATRTEIPNGQFFYALRADARGHKIEFISPNFKATYEPDPDPARRKGKPAADASPAPAGQQTGQAGQAIRRPFAARRVEAPVEVQLVPLTR
jgi:outer membrane protein assembly factor BamB/tetratricopeptide (TPR) repeat protein